MAEARRQREWERKLKDDGTMKPRVEGIISNFISTCGGVGAVLPVVDFSGMWSANGDVVQTSPAPGPPRKLPAVRGRL